VFFFLPLSIFLFFLLLPGQDFSWKKNRVKKKPIKENKKTKEKQKKRMCLVFRAFCSMRKEGCLEKKN
jgi:hypothetical protein